MNPIKAPISTVYDPYQLLRVYTYYRVLLGSLLLLIFKSNLIPNTLGSDNSALFFYTIATYTGVSLLALVSIWRHYELPSQQQRFMLLLLDAGAVIILMYTSGGASSGLGYLLIVTIAASGALLSSHLSLFLAAATTLAIFTESIVRQLTQGLDAATLFSAGTLGALVFITVLSFQYLTKKIRQSNLDAASQARHINHLQQLARLIIERMYTGIVVLNKDEEIELINNSAKYLLNPKGNNNSAPTLENIPALKQQLSLWREKGRHSSAQAILKTENGPSDELKFSITNLELGKEADTLIFIEDNRVIAQKAQQLKLASLGRLTASIAHEIRNPLGAIGHASQLLSESEQINNADQRLLDIIHTNTLRVNQIIENVLQVSRREISQPQPIELTQWIDTFIHEFYYDTKIGGALKKPHIETRFLTSQVHTKFDPSQLQQIITNLLDNALRYCDIENNLPAIILEAGIDPARGTPFLKIIDNGPGIPSRNQKHAFEPFFTTESSGSGLGLFICRELCEANHAYIGYTCNNTQPSCFTIEFVHPEKIQSVNMA